MAIWSDLAAMFASLSRHAAEGEVTLLLRTALPLTAAMSIAAALRSRHPRSRAGVLGAGIVASIAVGVLTLIPLGNRSALLTVALPDVGMHPIQAAMEPERAGPPAPGAAARRQASIPSDSGRIEKLRAPAEVGEASATPLKSSRRPAQRTSTPVYEAAVLVWLLGTCCLLAWFGVGRLRLSRLCRSAQPTLRPELAEALAEACALRHARAPRLLVSEDCISPFAFGLLRPQIVIPSYLVDALEPEALRAVLAHELDHVVARDAFWTLAGRVCCALLWPQPLVWITFRRWRDTVEEACDLFAVRSGASRRSFARSLLTVAERLTMGEPERGTAAGMAVSNSLLTRRIERILRGKETQMKRLPAAGVWMAAALLAASALFAGRLVGAQETVDIGRGAAPAIPATSATRPQTRPALASTPAHEPQATSDTERKAQMERERYRHELDQVRHEMAQREAENHRLQAEKVQHETAIRALQARVNELSRKRAAPAAGARRGSEELAVETARAQARQMASLSEQLDQRERQLTEMQLLYTESSPKVRESQAMRDTLKKRIDVLTAQAAERDLAVRTAQAKADQAQRAREETLAHRNALTAEQARERMHADAARRSQEDVAALRQQINELRREVEKLRQKQASSPSTGK